MTSTAARLRTYRPEVDPVGARDGAHRDGMSITEQSGEAAYKLVARELRSTMLQRRQSCGAPSKTPSPKT
jgi:hypothetical protein